MLITYPTKIKYYLIVLLSTLIFLFQQQSQAVKSKSHLLSSANKNTKKPVRLSQMAAQGADSWSNAFNFRKTADTATDPRTGIMSFHAKAGNLLSNSGHGPDIDLEVGYSSIARADPDGLGYGWSWNLSHFNMRTDQLTTSTGQSFYLQQQNNGQWYPLYHKLQDIHISGDKKTHFVISYANGLREILDHDGYEVALEQQDGWSVHFLYEPGIHQLRFITDDQGYRIVLNYKKNSTAVISRESRGQPVVVSLNKERGLLHSITLPQENNKTGPGIYIRYLGHLIKEIDYPTGLQKEFSYNCTDAMKMSTANDSLNRNTCVVSAEIIHPGASQPSMAMYYQYSKVNANHHNYLGFNAGFSAISSTFRDILFNAPVTYTYRTQTDNGLIRNIRTYNKYHLLINEQKMSDRTGKKISQVQTFFCRTDIENGCAHSSFADLPPTYSLPLKIVTKLWSDTAVLPAVTTETMHYDNQGRTVDHTDSFGRLTQIHYCPKTGDAACPAMPADWFFSMLQETVITYPAKTATLSPPPVTIHNHYRKMINHNNHGYMLVLDHQTEQAEKQYLTLTHYYYLDPNNLFTYGLLKQTVLSGSIQKPAALYSIINNYYYRNNMKDNSKTSYSTIETGPGKQRRSSSITTSLFTNQILQSSDSTGRNITCYHYDHWGRLIQTDFATDTTFAVSQHYHYTVSPQRNQLLITSVNGLQQKIIFDGAGRTLMHFTEALTGNGKPEPGHWIPLQRNTYDNFGRVAAQYSYMIKDSGEITPQVTTQDYDDSGRTVKLYLPDKETAVTEYDDAHRCVISYRLSNQKRRSPVSVMLANVLYQPVKMLLLPANDKPLPAISTLCNASDEMAKNTGAKVTSVAYDGFGRVTITTDPVGHIVKKHYNALGQVTDITNPLGDVIHSIYDLTGHVIQSWAQPASGGHYLLASAEYNGAGDLLWSAGEDGQRTRFTYTEDGKPASSTNPAGHTLSIQYNEIGLPVTNWLDGKLQLQLQYDPVTTLVKVRSGITGKTTFSYDTDGLIRQLIHSGKNGYPDYQLKWQYDKNRRIISMTDIGDNKTQTTYDTIGRAARVTYQPHNGKADTLSVLTYDDFSRLKGLQYGSGMERKLVYDNFGHPLTIKDTLANKLLSEWSFRYDASDNITTLIQQADSHQYAALHYQYDALNNLVSMTCKGSAGLPLCPRDTAFTRSGLDHAPVITRQDYTFTPLNRLASVREILQSSIHQQTLNKETDYRYSDLSAPLRLQQISTAWNYKSPVTHRFSYDVMGNMTTDGEGNHIRYNAFNQIVQVTKTNGQRSHYAYDSSGREVKTESNLGIRYLFYRGNEVINEKIISPGEHTHITGFLGVAKTIDGLISQYNESNYKGDVTGILTRVKKNVAAYELTQRNLYSPYGMVFHCNTHRLPLYKQTLHGFDGELTDPITGWQFLGNGHRTYNPEQRYFVSEDPAGDGYAFGSNNPIMNTDPGGNMPQWLGGVFKWMGYISSFGLSALHEKWANIAGAIITTGLTTVTLGVTASTYGGALLISAVMAGTAAVGSIPIAAAAIPANRGLNIAASVVGLTEVAAMFTTGAVDMGLFLAQPAISPVNKELELQDLKMLRVRHGAPRDAFHYDERSPIQILKEKTADLVDVRRQRISIKSFEDVERTWKELKSEKNDLVVCDTATLLMVSYQNKKALSLQDLTTLLKKKFDASNYVLVHGSDAIRSDSLKLQVVQQFKNILSRLSVNERPYVMTAIAPLKSFADVLKEPGMAVIKISGHAGVIKKMAGADNLWGIYIFSDDGTVALEQGSLDAMHEKFFSFSANGKKEISGYMLLK